MHTELTQEFWKEPVPCSLLQQPRESGASSASVGDEELEQVWLLQHNWISAVGRVIKTH